MPAVEPNQEEAPAAAVARGAEVPGGEAPPSRGRIQRLMQRAWWLHSAGALAFGCGVMIFARKGIEHADKVLTVLAASWLLVFIAFRFIVGPANTSPEDKRVKRGVRLVTNCIIKQLCQQRFFFLVPLYASSATWSLSSPNWWLVPLLLTCAVLSTLDLVFDHFIMERRVFASAMYGLCVFAVLNLTLPLVTWLSHFEALLLAAGVTAPTVALLSFRLTSVLSPMGLLTTAAVTAGLVLAAYFGRVAVPPAPMAMAHGAIGHGAPGEYECVPGPTKRIPDDQLESLRCVTQLSTPGGFDEDVVHVWRKDGNELARVAPERMTGCDGVVLKSQLGDTNLPKNPRGRWTCTAETSARQLIGRTTVQVVEPWTSEATRDAPSEAPPSGAVPTTPTPATL